MTPEQIMSLADAKGLLKWVEDAISEARSIADDVGYEYMNDLESRQKKLAMKNDKGDEDMLLSLFTLIGMETVKLCMYEKLTSEAKNN